MASCFCAALTFLLPKPHRSRQAGAIVLRIKVSRSQLERRSARQCAALPSRPGVEAGCGSHHIARQLRALGHEVRLIPAQYVKAFLKGHENDYRDAEAIAVGPCGSLLVGSAPTSVTLV